MRKNRCMKNMRFVIVAVGISELIIMEVDIHVQMVNFHQVGIPATAKLELSKFITSISPPGTRP